MFTRLRLLALFALICVCSNAMAVTGATTYTGPGFSIDGCFGADFGSVATPILSDGKKICALVEIDQYPFNDNSLHLVIDGFTSDPGSNYFNNLALSCGLGLPAAAGSYYYFPATAGSSGVASWTFDIFGTICISDDGSLSID